MKTSLDIYNFNDQSQNFISSSISSIESTKTNCTIQQNTPQTEIGDILAMFSKRGKYHNPQAILSSMPKKCKTKSGNPMKHIEKTSTPINRQSCVCSYQAEKQILGRTSLVLIPRIDFNWNVTPILNVSSAMTPRLLESHNIYDSSTSIKCVSNCHSSSPLASSIKFNYNCAKCEIGNRVTDSVFPAVNGNVNKTLNDCSLGNVSCKNPCNVIDSGVQHSKIKSRVATICPLHTISIFSQTSGKENSSKCNKTKIYESVTRRDASKNDKKRCNILCEQIDEPLSKHKKSGIFHSSDSKRVTQIKVSSHDSGVFLDHCIANNNSFGFATLPGFMEDQCLFDRGDQCLFDGGDSVLPSEHLPKKLSSKTGM